jgi:hypothetical protein
VVLILLVLLFVILFLLLILILLLILLTSDLWFLIPFSPSLLWTRPAAKPILVEEGTPAAAYHCARGKKEGAAMLGLKKWVWAAAVAAATTAPAVAQQGGVNTGGGRPTGTLGGGGLTATTVGGLGGSGGLNTIGPTGGAGGGGLGGGAQGAGAGSDLGGTQLLQMQRAPQLAPPTGTARGSLSSANFLAGYYADPRFQGLINSQLNAAPGGFGLPLYPTTGAGGAGGALNRTGALGGGLAGGGLAGRQAGLGGLGQNANQSGILIPLPVQIAYTAEIRFPTTPVAPAAIQADLRGIIDRAPMIASPQNVQVIVAGGNNVTLRGTVKDDEEARLVEGLVRLTPGVGEIKNELTFPTAGK